MICPYSFDVPGGVQAHVVELAEVFHRQVIAEGVETKALGDLLLDIGCERAQGYGIARPMPAKDLPAWVMAWHAHAAWTG